jgi:hypothetical protein
VVLAEQFGAAEAADIDEGVIDIGNAAFEVGSGHQIGVGRKAHFALGGWLIVFHGKFLMRSNATVHTSNSRKTVSVNGRHFSWIYHASSRVLLCFDRKPTTKNCREPGDLFQKSLKPCVHRSGRGCSSG